MTNNGRRDSDTAMSPLRRFNSDTAMSRDSDTAMSPIQNKVAGRPVRGKPLPAPVARKLKAGSQEQSRQALASKAPNLPRDATQEASVIFQRQEGRDALQCQEPLPIVTPSPVVAGPSEFVEDWCGKEDRGFSEESQSVRRRLQGGQGEGVIGSLASVNVACGQERPDCRKTHSGA
jgi:hypothetical protein